MADMNKWMGSGRLTRTPDLRYTGGGTAVLDIGLASNHVYSKKVGDEYEKVEETLFMDITVWGKQAESLNNCLKKGQVILVEGRLKLDTWETDGNKRSKVSCVADKIHLLPRNTEGKSEEAVAAGNVGDDDAPF